MKVIKFTKIRYIMFALSLLVITGGLVIAFTQGPNWGIDFRNGVSMTISVKSYDSATGEIVPAVAAEGDSLLAEVRTYFSLLESEPVIQLQSDKESRFSIRSVITVGDEGDSADDVLLASKQKELLVSSMKSNSSVVDVVIKEVESDSLRYDALLKSGFDGRLIVIESSQSSGSAWTANSTKQLISLLLVAMLLITIYIWFRFKWSFAIGAMVALMHDVAIMVGIICIMPFEVSKTTVAAILTIIGYSLNDTIVVFDRIRENQRLMAEDASRVIINTSISQSLSRTIITSLTTFVAVLALFLLAEGEVKSFAANMMVGVIVGTYSSIFIASPVLLELMNLANSIARRKKKKKFGAGSDSIKKYGDDVVSVDEGGEIVIPKIERKPRRKKR